MISLIKKIKYLIVLVGIIYLILPVSCTCIKKIAYNKILIKEIPPYKNHIVDNSIKPRQNNILIQNKTVDSNNYQSNIKNEELKKNESKISWLERMGYTVSQLMFLYVDGSGFITDYKLVFNELSANHYVIPSSMGGLFSVIIFLFEKGYKKIIYLMGK